MAGVADQGKRIAPKAAEELNDGKGERQRDRKAQHARLRLFRRVQPVAVASPVAGKLGIGFWLLKNVVEMLLFGHDEMGRMEWAGKSELRANVRKARTTAGPSGL